MNLLPLKKLLERNFFLYLLLQFFIFFVPPALAAIMFDTNHYMTSFFEEYIGYSVGLTGLFLMLFLLDFIDNEVIASSIYLLIKIITLYFFISAMYLKLRSFRWVSYLISLLLVAWGILFGMFWMFAAMQ